MLKTSLLKSYTLKICFALGCLTLSLEAAETRGVDVGALGNVYDFIKGDAMPLGWGYGGGALVNWQWSPDWRGGVQIGCASICAGNLELGYRAYTFLYSRFRYPDRLLYYIIGLGSNELWLRFVTGVNSVKGMPHSLGLVSALRYTLSK